MAAIVPMPRQGDRSPSLLLPPRVALLLNPFPAPAPSVGWGLRGRSSGAAAEESGRPGRPLQQAEMCAVPQPRRRPKRSSGREAGWRHIGPRHAGHSCCPCLPVGPLPPGPSGPLLPVLRPDRATARGLLSVSPHSLPRGPGEAGGLEPASPAERNGAAGSSRDVPAADGPALAPKSRCGPAPQPCARVCTQEGCQRRCWAAAPHGPTGRAGPGGRGRVAALRQSWGAQAQAA